MNLTTTQTAIPTATISSTGTNQAVLQFDENKDTPFSCAMLIYASILATISAVGICLNSCVVFATIRSKMRGTCHQLLALTSALEVCHQLSHFVFFVVVAAVRQFLRYLDCVRIQTLSIFGLNALQVCLLATAVDRLHAIVCPIFYKKMNENRRASAICLGALIGATLCYGVVSVLYFLANAPADQNYLACDIGDTFDFDANYYFFLWNTLAINVVTASLYAVVGIVARKKIRSLDAQRKLFKSLLTIVSMNVGGYFVNLSMLYLGFTYLPLSWMWYEQSFNGILLNIAAASNAPILYAMSSEYRSAFKQHILRQRDNVSNLSPDDTIVQRENSPISWRRREIQANLFTPARRG